MKKFIVLLLVCAFAISAMATYVATTMDPDSSTLNIRIESICWLTFDEGAVGKRSWTIDNDDFAQVASDASGYGGNDEKLNVKIDNEPNTLGKYAEFGADAGNPLSYAVFAVDAVTGYDGVGTEPEDATNHEAQGLRVAVDSNDRNGFDVTIKADAAVFTGQDANLGINGPVDETIPVGQVSWWTLDSQYDSGNSTNPYGSFTNGGSGWGSIMKVGPEHMAEEGTTNNTQAKIMKTAEQLMFQTADEGANVTTLNFGLVLYTLDAFDTKYTAPFTITAYNRTYSSF